MLVRLPLPPRWVIFGTILVTGTKPIGMEGHGCRLGGGSWRSPGRRFAEDGVNGEAEG